MAIVTTYPRPKIIKSGWAWMVIWAGENNVVYGQKFKTWQGAIDFVTG